MITQMRLCLFIFILGSSLGINAQNIIFFPELVHNFGIITEKGGIVRYEFPFHNRSPYTAKITQVKSGCGCTIGTPSSMEVASGESANIQVIYNPAGRPGSFVKSVQIDFDVNGDPVSRFLNVKGFVADERYIDIPDPEDVRFAFKLAPYRAEVLGVSDTFFYQTEDFQTFVNDITYAIDEDGFVNVKIKITYAKHAGEVWANAFENRIKSSVRDALRTRMYNKYPAGFDVETIALPELPAGVLLKFEMYALKHTDFSLSESVITPIIKQGPAAGVKKLVPFEPPVNLAEVRYIPFSKKWFKTKNFSDYSNLERTLRTSALTGDTLILGSALYVPGFSVKEIGKKVKRAESFQKALVKSLVKSGVSDKIIYEQPLIVHTLEAPNFKEGFYACRYVRMLPWGSQFLIPDEDVWIERDVVYTEEAKLPVQNLPAYLKFLDKPGVRLDTSDMEFQRIMKLLMSRIQQGYPVKLLVESSSSNIPTNQKFDNHYVAALRAKESIILIKEWLAAKGFDASILQFESSVNLVQGPEYNPNHFQLNYYQQFQYIKLLPVYETTYNIAEARLFPYVIHFGFGFTELEADTDVFRAFCDHIASVIQKSGYLKLIIESSSSKVPTFIAHNNEILAWRRAEDARRKLMQGLRERGVDPMRLIILEERALVQGPQYKGDIWKNPEKYEPFQYIKLIPEAIVKQ